MNAIDSSQIITEYLRELEMVLGKIKYFLGGYYDHSAWLQWHQQVRRSIESPWPGGPGGKFTDASYDVFREFRDNPNLAERTGNAIHLIGNIAKNLGKLRSFYETLGRITPSDKNVGDLLKNGENQFMGSIFEFLGMAELIMACDFKGFTYDIYPKIKTTEVEKELDIRIKVNDRWINIDFKALGFSKNGNLIIDSHTTSRIIRAIEEKIKGQLQFTPKDEANVVFVAGGSKFDLIQTT